MAIQVPLNPQLQNATQLTQQIQNAVNAVKLNLGGAGGGRALNSLSQPLGRLTGQADEFTKSLDAANARVLAFGASVGVVNALTNAFKAMVNTTIMVEKTLADINVVFNKSSEEIKNFGKGIFSVAKQTGQSFEEVSKAALEFSRQGLTIEDTLARTKDALILTRLTGLDTAKAVQGLTATINSFSKEALTSSEIINKLASVDQKFSVSAADLTEALSRSASVAQNAGVSFDELIGIVTSLQERTARGGAVIGNSIKTIFTRIQRPEVLVDLKNLGVAVKDIKTEKLLSASEILKNLAGNIGALGQIQKSGIFEEVAGGFQINQLQALLTDLAGAQSTASKAQQVSTAATNEAYTANERLNKTISALINNSVEGLKELGATLGDLGISDSIKSALGVVNGFIENVQGLLEGDGPGAKFAQGIVKGIGSVLSGPGLALFGVIISKLVIDLGKFAVQGLKTFLGIGKAAAEQKALQEAIVITLSRNSNLQAQINKFQGNSVAQAAILAGIYNQQEASLKRQASIAAGMASTLYGGGMRVGPQGFTQTGRRAAGGYLPSAEASDVSRGVGGASPSSRVVSIPNFAFGNGQKGTMVANTSEYIVPNFANGGSAIFNQDMISSMGLPAGAQKIRAAGGYVPNFAKKERERRDPRVDIYWDGKGSRAENESTLSNLIIDADHDIGGIGMLTAGGNEGSPRAAYNFSISNPDITAASVPALKNSKWGQVRDEKTQKIVPSPITVKNLVGANGLAKFSESSPEGSRLQFSNELSNFLYAPLIDLTNKIFGQKLALGKAPMFTNEGKDSFISPSVEGAIFQEMISLVSDQFSEKSTALKGEDNRPFDFEAKGPASKEFADSFFGGKPIFKADAKRSDSSYNRGTLLKKMFNDPEVLARLKSTRKDIFAQLPENLDVYQGSNKAQTISKTNLEADDFKNPIKKASKGYIPNFANKALADSINRERIQSGLPVSAISVTQDSRLMNSRNPTGLAVINSRDEPNGKIPNFVNPQPLTNVSFTRQASLDLGTSLDLLNKKIKELAAEVSKNTKTEAEAQVALKQFVTDLPNARKTGVKLGQSTSGKNIQDVASAQLSDSVPQKVAKGFGDVVGKIFLFQTALSFATGAAGDLESSTAKLAAKFSETATNVASFGLLGQQLMESSPASALGKVTKNLGLVGLGAGVLYEGFKLADFAIKEYTGENEKAASALAKLETAAQSAAISLADLTPEGQRATQEVGKAALESMKGSFFSTGPAKNPEIQKQAGLLAAQGLSGDKLKSLIENNVAEIVASRRGFVAENGKTSVAKYLESGIQSRGRQKISDLLSQAQESDVSQALSNLFKNPEVIKSGQGLATIREKIRKGTISPREDAEGVAKAQFGEGGYTEVQVDRIRQMQQLAEGIKTTKEASIKVERDFALGEQISLDLAKQKVDNLLEQKNLEIESVGPVERQLKLELETLDLTKASSIEKQRQLELIKLQKTEQQGIVKAIGSTIDELSKLPSDALVLGVSVNNYQKIAQSLEGKDFKNIEEAKAAVSAIAESLGIQGTQLDSVNKKFTESFEVNKKLLDIQRGQVNAASDLEIEADKTKQAYESQLYAITRIAALAKATADLNVSGLGKEKAGIGAQISTIESANANPYLGVLDKQANEKAILELKLQQLEVDRKINAENKNAQSINTTQEIEKNKIELDKVRTGGIIAGDFSSDGYLNKAKKFTDEISRLEKEQAKNANDLASETTNLDSSIAQLKNQLDNISKRGTFTEGLRSGLQELENNTLNFQNTLGKEIPQLFSSNLAQGLNDAISGAKSLKEALTDAATSFFNAITQKNIQNLADRFTIGIGNIGKASGGMIKGGSGTKDDIPAMLMGGEYVLKKSAVQKYGSNFLDSLNKGKISGYAAGGGVQSGSGGFYVPGEYGQGAITGKKQLLDFATQSLTSGQFDQMGSYGMTGASINLEGESGRLTMAGRENSPMFERVQQAKEEAFQVYLESFKVDEQYQNQLKEIKDADKARKKKLMTSIAMAVATTAASAGAAGFSNAYGASAGQGFFSRIGSGLSGAIGKGGGTGKGGIGNLLSGNFSDAFNNLNVGIQKPTGYSSGIPGLINTASDGFYNPYPNPKRANGGPILGGSGVRDDVPAMLTGGEFVLNNRATKKLGMSNLNRLNSGDTSSQQGSSDLTQALISKLDELISVTEKTGGDSVVVNVSGAEAQGEKTDGAKSSNERDLQRKIKAAVLEVITQEKRLGGSLNK